MSTVTQTALNANSRPAVIRHTEPLGGAAASRGFLDVLPAWIVSAVVHGVMGALFFLFLLAIDSKTKAGDANQNLYENQTVVDSKVEDDGPLKDLNLTNSDLGINPDVALNYDYNRLAEFSVPGLVIPNANVGLAGEEQTAPKNVPPPPGVGNGVGGGLDMANAMTGNANPFATAGGMGGVFTTPGGFGGRVVSGATRMKQVEMGGGNARSEQAVALGLEWLALHQSDDGSWSLDGFHTHGKDKLGPGGKRIAPTCNCEGHGAGKHDIAGTAFGLLPFLGAGETHKGSQVRGGGTYMKVVENGIKHLLAKQGSDGGFSHNMYEHGLATIAICEAYGLSSDPVLRSRAQKALDFIVKAQNDTGGWRYRSNSTDADTSVVGWQVMALKSGQMAGLNVPQKTMEGATKWFDSVMTKDASGYGYMRPEQATPARTAIGLLCRQYLGWSRQKPELLAGVDRLNRTPPPDPGKPAAGGDGMYYYYYATQVMHHMGGDSWSGWNPNMRDFLIRSQDLGNDPKHTHQRGSWDPAHDRQGGAGGRIMTTSLCILTLEVYYRHLPLYGRDLGVFKDQKP